VLVAAKGSLAGLARLARRLLVLPVRRPLLLAVGLLTERLLTVRLLTVRLLTERLLTERLLTERLLTERLLTERLLTGVAVSLRPVGVGVRLAGLATVGPTRRELCGGLCRACGWRLYRSDI
jgi:hypothetical protein